MVIAITLVRDEADIVGRTAAHMLTQVDHVIALDNGSIDGTREILERVGVEVHDDPEPGHFQSRKLSRLAEIARGRGADFVVPFDADELWYARRGRLANVLERLPAEALIAEALLYDHVSTSDDPDDPDPTRRMGWRRAEPLPLRKVACRTAPGLLIREGNHAASYPDVRYPLTVTDELVVRHFPVRSPEQWVRKARNGAAALAATDLPADVGSHWRGWGNVIDNHGEQRLADAFHQEWFSDDPQSDDLVHDPAL